MSPRRASIGLALVLAAGCVGSDGDIVLTADSVRIAVDTVSLVRRGDGLMEVVASTRIGSRGGRPPRFRTLHDCRTGRQLVLSITSAGRGGQDSVRLASDWVRVESLTPADILQSWVCGAPASTRSEPQRWLMMGRTPDIEVLLDLESIVRTDDGRAAVRLRVDSLGGRPSGSPADGTPMALDCQRRSYHTGWAGSDTLGLPSRDDASWQPIVPETFLDALAARACG